MYDYSLTFYNVSNKRMNTWDVDFYMNQSIFVEKYILDLA
jgi:hypothetical protein